MAVPGRDDDVSDHTGLKVAWLKARHTPGSRGFKGPAHNRRLPWLHGDSVVAVVVALGRLAHEFGVLSEFFFLSDHQFVTHFARIDHNQTHGLALGRLPLRGDEAKAVVHVNHHGSYRSRFGGLAGRARRFFPRMVV